MKAKLIGLASWAVFLVSATVEFGLELDFPLTPTLWLAIAVSILFASTAHAQFTASIKTNTISGVVSNWVGNYIIGSNTFKDVLQVVSHGVLSDNNGYLSYPSSANGSNNLAVVSDPGSVWTNSGNLYVGAYGKGNAMTITNGGVVFDYYGFIGNGITTNNNVTVTGTGSVWNNFAWVEVGDEGSNNTLTIANGGAVLDTYGYVGYLYFGSNNMATVTGSGSVWSNSGDLVIGAPGPANKLIITNGGAAFNVDGYVGQTYTAYGNAATITGAGSAWHNSGVLYVGSSANSNVLTIAGGSVLASNVLISAHFRLAGYGIPSNNVVRVNSGSLFVTNALGNGALVVSEIGGLGSLIINGGSVTADELLATNGANSVILFNGGTIIAGSAVIANGQDFVIGAVTNATYVPDGGRHSFNNNLEVRRGSLLLNSGTVIVNQLVVTNGANSMVTFGGGGVNTAGTVVTNGQQFIVGNGATGANFHLLGGVHSFADGLRIRNASTLTGCGTVNGTVVVDAGGTVMADCGGTLLFTGSVTNNYAMAANNGSTLESSGTLVNNGAILLYNGGTYNFTGTFINNGVISNAGSVIVTQNIQSGNDEIIQTPSALGFRYQLQVSPSLGTPVWTNIGASQPGTGGILSFTDPGGATNKPTRFYRVDCLAP